MLYLAAGTIGPMRVMDRSWLAIPVFKMLASFPISHRTEAGTSLSCALRWEHLTTASDLRQLEVVYCFQEIDHDPRISVRKVRIIRLSWILLLRTLKAIWPLPSGSVNLLCRRSVGRWSVQHGSADRDHQTWAQLRIRFPRLGK